jgi:hypothetical protein
MEGEKNESDGIGGKGTIEDGSSRFQGRRYGKGPCEDRGRREGEDTAF